MIVLNLTSACAPHPKITFYINGNFTVSRSHNANRDGTYDTVVNDGSHNNGGWSVQESPEDINWRIAKQLEKECK
jgi:hypothetical protein